MFSGKQHSQFDPRDCGLNRIQKTLQGFFPERQLIVRSGERMRTLRLSTNRQAVLVVVGLFLGAWTLFSSGLAMNHGERIGVKNIEIKNARMGYEQLLAEVTIYKDRVTDLTEELASNYSKSLGLVQKEAEALKAKAAELERRSQKKSLSPKIKSKAKEATPGLASLLTGGGSSVDLLLSKTTLDRGHADEERHALMTELSDLENLMVNVVAHHQRTPFVAMENLALRQVILQRDLAMAERETLSEKVVSLGDQIREMESNQLFLHHRFSEVIETKIADIEASLSITGLDIDLLVRGEKARPQGGPFIPLNAVSQESGPLQESVFKLNAKIDRLQDLQGLLTKLPLDAPVNNFDLTSGFGIRKDPFTGNYAQHLGIDIAASFRSSVLSPGEGKVVHAGVDGSYGRMVEIDHGMGLISRYAHMRKLAVKKGDMLVRGTVIGEQGCTGRCKGAHVHYEVLYNGKHINPLKFLQAGSDVFKDQ